MMSILIVNDIDINNNENTIFFESIMNCLRILFVDDTFIQEYSEYLFSVYNVLEKHEKETILKNFYCHELFWYPVGNSCLNFLSIYKKVIEYMSNNKLPFVKEEIDYEDSKKSLFVENSLKPVELSIKEIFSEEVALEHRIYQNDQNGFENICNQIPNANSSINKDNDLVIGKERQLLILWLMSFDNYVKRKKVGNLPKFQDIYESCIIPNVKIEYIPLKRYDSQVFDEFKTGSSSYEDCSYFKEHLIKIPNIINEDESIKMKDFILQILNTTFFSEKYTVSLSPVATLSELDYFDDLSVIGFHLYPNLNAFPLFFRETLENLAIPPYSTIVGILPLEKYQPLPIVTRRLIEIKNSSSGKIRAIKALTLALYEDKFTIALELDSKWFALLNSITIGSNIHLALDILLPGFIIMEDN